MRGTLLDFSTAIESDRSIVEVAGMTERCQLVAGECIQSVPTGGNIYLSGLKQKLSPNKAQTLFISHKYVAIMIEPLNKTERYSCTKSL